MDVSPKSDHQKYLVSTLSSVNVIQPVVHKISRPPAFCADILENNRLWLVYGENLAHMSYL